MAFFGRNKLEERDQIYSISDPAFAEFLSLSPSLNYSGITVGETSALALTAVWRAIDIISTTIAQLPSYSSRESFDGTHERVSSWLDNPALGLYTKFEFWELVIVHLLIHGNAFLRVVRNQGGGIAGAYPIHPLSVSVEVHLDSFSRSFRVTRYAKDGSPETVYMTEDEILHIPGKTLDGCRGLSIISVFANSLGITAAGDRATARNFNNGTLISGLVTPDQDDVTEEDAKQIKQSLDRKVSGWEHAGELAFINRQLKFQPWTATPVDAQFMEQREFQIEECARIWGVPPFELMQTEKQTSFGAGIEARQRGLSRQTLGPLTSRIAERTSMLLPRTQTHHFDFLHLERPNPETQAQIITTLVNGGIMTPNEGRERHGLPAIEGGDTLKGMSTSNDTEENNTADDVEDENQEAKDEVDE